MHKRAQITHKTGDITRLDAAGDLEDRKLLFVGERGIELAHGDVKEISGASVKVDQVKLAAGDEEVPTTLLKVQLPDSALAKLAAAPRGTTVKEQFGMSLIDEYGIPPGLDFRTSARIGEKRTPRKGESCVLPLI